MVNFNNLFRAALTFIVVIPQITAHYQEPYTIQTETPTIQEETLHINPLIKTEHTLYEDQNCNQPQLNDTREVEFRNDAAELAELDILSRKIGDHALNEQEEACIKHFQETPLIIRAEEREYQTRHGDEITVETRDSWELTLKEVNNEHLLALGTFHDLVTEHFMPKKDFKNFLDTYIWNPYNKAKLYVYRKVMARFAKTTFTIHAQIDQSLREITCSDIILDIDLLADEGRLAIEVSHNNLLSMQITLKEIA